MAANRSTRLWTLHSARLLRSGRWGRLRCRPGAGRTRRCRRWPGRTQTREHFIGEVKVLVCGHHDTRLILGVEDHGVAFFGAQLVDHLVDLLHDRPHELRLTLPHLLLQLLRAALILLLFRTNVLLPRLLRLR